MAVRVQSSALYLVQGEDQGARVTLILHTHTRLVCLTSPGELAAVNTIECLLNAIVYNMFREKQLPWKNIKD